MPQAEVILLWDAGGVKALVVDSQPHEAFQPHEAAVENLIARAGGPERHGRPLVRSSGRPRRQRLRHRPDLGRGGFGGRLVGSWADRSRTATMRLRRDGLTRAAASRTGVPLLVEPGEGRWVWPEPAAIVEPAPGAGGSASAGSTSQRRSQDSGALWWEWIGGMVVEERGNELAKPSHEALHEHQTLPCWLVRL